LLRGEDVDPNIGACPPLVFAFVAMLALVNELRVEISDAEKLSTVTRSDSVPPKLIRPSGKR
ncbi:hypothetical protein J0672_23925, partial [Vibrio parahaemolyticus]|nr:hypothetical protein [Vibrio parahaemolyticus]